MNEAGPCAFVLAYLTGTGSSDGGEGGLPIDILIPGVRSLSSAAGTVSG